MKDIFITATNTNIGKTYTTLKLLYVFAQSGYKVGAFKPIETGVKNYPEDAVLLLETSQKLNPDFNSLTVNDICPIQFSLPAAPYVAKEKNKIDFEKIYSSFKKLKMHCDILLIEGAGGLLVPVEDNFYMIDFIKFFDANTLLVTHDRLGSINDTLLSIEALKNRDIPHSWCINHFEDTKDFKKITLPFYQKEFKKIFSIQENLDELAQELITYCNSNRN
jgi:dethiobiotin synthetase